MSAELMDALRHNAWATGELLTFCRGLSPEQLQATATGTYGTVLSTLQHILGAEGRYRFRLSGAEPGWGRRPEETEDLEELSRMAEDLASSWDDVAAGSFDPERTISGVDRQTGRPFEVRAGVLLAQVLNHGNEHRAQIFTILTTLGIEPPQLDAWAYGEATGRFVWKPPDGAR